ncbi:CNT_collapsed_G0029590.mRNA.1.CDS.1 [Saccharomyces cerevisiae]|nr:CNT_collapsed_G0029590.mRNA.1.CDS.1 [Saccharomyces cerevisiae]
MVHAYHNLLLLMMHIPNTLTMILMKILTTTSFEDANDGFKKSIRWGASFQIGNNESENVNSSEKLPSRTTNLPTVISTNITRIENSSQNTTGNVCLSLPTNKSCSQRVDKFFD